MKVFLTTTTILVTYVTVQGFPRRWPRVRDSVIETGVRRQYSSYQPQHHYNGAPIERYSAPYLHLDTQPPPPPLVHNEPNLPSNYYHNYYYYNLPQQQLPPPILTEKDVHQNQDGHVQDSKNGNTINAQQLHQIRTEPIRSQLQANHRENEQIKTQQSQYVPIDYQQTELAQPISNEYEHVLITETQRGQVQELPEETVQYQEQKQQMQHDQQINYESDFQEIHASTPHQQEEIPKAVQEQYKYPQKPYSQRINDHQNLPLQEGQVVLNERIPNQQIEQDEYLIENSEPHLIPPIATEEIILVPELGEPDNLVDMLDPSFRLVDLTDEHIDVFLADEDSVQMLSDCFMDLKQCESASAINLINQIKSLGTGGKCEACDEEEQARMEDIVYQFILKYSTSYPLLWLKALPRLGFLLVDSWM